jgi:hypothetical protein
MNQRQQERFEELGRAYQDELKRILESDRDPQVEYDIEPMMDESAPMKGYVEEPSRSLNHDLAPHVISITQVHNGFIVDVGCQRFAFETYDKMSKYMKMYYEDPRGVCDKHSSGELFGK